MEIKKMKNDLFISYYDIRYITTYKYDFPYNRRV